MSDAHSCEVKSDAHRLIDALPHDATWDDVMYHIYVRQCIEAGLEDADAGRIVDLDQVRQSFGPKT